MAKDLKKLETKKLVALFKSGGCPHFLKDDLYQELFSRDDLDESIYKIDADQDFPQIAILILSNLQKSGKSVDIDSEKFWKFILRLSNVLKANEIRCSEDAAKNVVKLLSSLEKKIDFGDERQMLSAIIEKLNPRIMDENYMERLHCLAENPIPGINYVDAIVASVMMSQESGHCISFHSLVKDIYNAFTNDDDEFGKLCLVTYFYRELPGYAVQFAADFQKKLMEYYEPLINNCIGGEDVSFHFPSEKIHPTIYWDGTKWAFSLDYIGDELSIWELIATIRSIVEDKFDANDKWAKLEKALFSFKKAETEIRDLFENVENGKYISKYTTKCFSRAMAVGSLTVKKTLLKPWFFEKVVFISSDIYKGVFSDGQNVEILLHGYNFSKVGDFKDFWRIYNYYILNSENASNVVDMVFKKLEKDMPDTVKEITEVITPYSLPQKKFVTATFSLNNVHVAAHYFVIQYVLNL